MLKTLGIVDACCGSATFRANATRKLGGRPVLEWVVRRVTDSMRLDGVIVVACDRAESRALGRLVPSDVPVWFSNAPDFLAGFVAALEQYPAEAAVRVRGDNLFVDPALIDRLVTAAESGGECDYVAYGSRDGRPAILSPMGVYAEWFRARALRRADRAATDPQDRTDVTRYFYRHPRRFHVRLIPAPTEIDREDVRLTLEGDEDWDHALAIYDALGPEAFDWQRIARFLTHQPAMRSRMAALNRASA
jgi:spore coat polysaccharide biosynthesis protein SpsF (cytidylyltransferase family)